MSGPTPKNIMDVSDDQLNNIPQLGDFVYASGNSSVQFGKSGNQTQMEDFIRLEKARRAELGRQAGSKQILDNQQKLVDQTTQAGRSRETLTHMTNKQDYLFGGGGSGLLT